MTDHNDYQDNGLYLFICLITGSITFVVSAYLAFKIGVTNIPQYIAGLPFEVRGLNLALYIVFLALGIWALMIHLLIGMLISPAFKAKNLIQSAHINKEESRKVIAMLYKHAFVKIGGGIISFVLGCFFAWLLWGHWYPRFLTGINDVTKWILFIGFCYVGAGGMYSLVMRELPDHWPWLKQVIQYSDDLEKRYAMPKVVMRKEPSLEQRISELENEVRKLKMIKSD